MPRVCVCVCVCSLLWLTLICGLTPQPECSLQFLFLPGIWEETGRRHVSLFPLESTDPFRIYFWSKLLVTLLAAFLYVL